MRVTRNQLRQIIREAISEHRDTNAGGPTKPDRWWEYDPRDVMRDVYWQRGEIPPTDPEAWERQWKHIKRQLEDRYPKK
jgi:hypothetical protein